MPVRARRARARERLPSYRDLPSLRSRVGQELTLVMSGPVRAPFRRLSARAPRQAGLSSFLRAERLFHHEALRPPGDETRDASDRLLPSVRDACTRTSCVPGPLPQLSLRGRRVESWAPRDMTEGGGVSRHPRPLRGIRDRDAASSRAARLAAAFTRRGRFVPTALRPNPPLTPLSPLPLPTDARAPSRSFARDAS